MRTAVAAAGASVSGARRPSDPVGSLWAVRAPGPPGEGG